jgi:PAS domain S-box-containing protein
MNFKTKLAKLRKAGPWRDLLVIVLGAIVVFVFAAMLDLLEEALELLHNHEELQLDEAIVVMWYLAFALMVFSFRRYRDLQKSVRERQTSEAALAASEERFQLVARATNDAIWDWNIVTHDLWWNDRLPNNYGYKTHQLERTFATWISLIHPDDLEQVTSHHESTLQSTANTWISEYRFRREDGSYAFVLNRAFIERDEHGKPTRMIGSVVDLTDRKNAELALKTREILLSEAQRIAHLGSWRIDLDTKELVWSDELWRIFGLEPQPEGMDLEAYLDLVHPDDKLNVANIIKAGMEAKSDFSYDYRLIRPDGEVVTVQANRQIICSEAGVPIQMVGSDQDITAQRKMESELKLARDVALESSRIKSEFLANMSHEIRTPMNGIIGMTELTLDTELDHEQRENLKMVKESADSLLSIINDILDFSKIEAGKLDLEMLDFDLSEALKNTLMPLAIRADQKGLELTFDVPPDVATLVSGDPNRLRQIVVNLVGNAIKFTEHGEVAVAVSEIERTVDKVCLHFRIRDTGIGIPPEKQALIFDSFSQADGSTTRKYGGTGLGLAITTQLVGLMGGRIWLESSGLKGEGSVFNFTVNLKINSGALLRSKPVNDLRNLHVLVVDDNATNRTILERTLHYWGMRTVVVEGGEAALVAMRQAVESHRSFDLVLLDAHMPDTDGFMVVQRIRQTPGLTGAAIMMLSSADHTTQLAACRELGLDSYLVKPIGRSDLLTEIRRILGQRPVTRPTIVRRPASTTTIVGPSLRILLTEDNQINQHLAIRLLQKRGHEVTLAHNGLEAVELSTTSQFDLILMDIQMPVMNGYEATKLIRAHEEQTGNRVPIVAMTAYAMKGDSEKCLEVGMDGYVSKPIQAADMFETIERLTKGNLRNEEMSNENSVFDLEALLERTDGDHDLARDLAAIFITDCPLLLRRIEKALKAEELEGLQQAAHTMKGAVSYFTSGVALEASDRLQNITTLEQSSEANEALKLLQQSLDSLLNSLDSFAAVHTTA